ncbi:MAG: bifunctional metallophosphatase/5'-nucleotidase [Bacteroidales bacterium]|nr:bifunctional metallophosphatase/5'-nucleotidase [Bacteroidales bacterium]
MKVFRVFFVLATVILLLGNVHAQEKAKVIGVTPQDIVVLYDNDVHCAIDGYVGMAALRDEVLQKTPHVAVVSSGDFASGDVIGALSKGEYLIRAMNAVGYDYVTLGNHEFDFGVPHFNALTAQLTAHVLCCNFQTLPDGKNVFDAYDIKDFGGVKVAFIGVATPATYSSTSSKTFVDSEGNYLYSFHTDGLPQWVQQQVDAVRLAGADYVVLLSHLGIDGPSITSLELIAQTTGIDVVLDGHSHSTIASRQVNDKAGKPVVLTSTGTAFANYGALIIRDNGTLSTVLVPAKEVTEKNAEVQAKIDVINAEYKVVADRVVGHTDVKLSVYDDAGKRLVRRQESNAGDFVADAFRLTMGTDIGWTNGGGCRKDVPAGDFTVGKLYGLCSFDSRVVVASVSGQTLLDALEMAAHGYPEEFGGFAQVSGMTYEIDTTIRTSVALTDKKVFIEVTGERRVKNVRIFNQKKEKYQKLKPKKWYTIASLNFILLYGGDGMIFNNLHNVQETDIPQQIIIERYIKEHLGGNVGQQYAKPQGRIQLR